MLTRSDLWVAFGVLTGAAGLGLMFLNPRTAAIVMLCLIVAIGCFLMAGVAREREREHKVSNTRPDEWERYDR